VLFMLGIAAHDLAPHRPDVWLVMAGLLVVATVVADRWSFTSSVCLVGAVLLSGLAAAQVERFHYPRNHVSAFASETRRLAQVELYLDEPPRLLTGQFGNLRALPPKQALTARVTRVLTWDGWVDARGDVLVQISQPHPRLAAGQTVRVMGMLERPAPAMNPGQFDWARYYREQRILVSLQVNGADNVRILRESAPHLVARLRGRVRHALAAGFTSAQALDHALLRALVLGDRDPELRDVQEQFRRTGTSHHLAISGMHVAVLGGVVFWLCRLLRVRPRTAAVVGMVFVALYGLAALPSPPVVRSVLLCLAFGFGIVRGRSVDALQLLALSVLAMLVYHPLDLFNAGFQLSFVTVLGLILLTGLMLDALTTQRDRDRFIAAGARPPDSLTAASMWADRKLLQVLAAAVVAWLVSFPLVASHFEQLNPWAVVASILMAPVVFVALVGGMLKIVLTLLWPGLAGTWASWAAAPVEWMRGSVELLARLPWSEVPLPAPPLWLVCAFYVALVAALWSWRGPGVRWVMRSGALGCGAAIVLLPYSTAAPVRPASDELRVTLLAVGAGQCAVVEPPSGRVILIDAGSASLSDLLRKCLAPYLRHRGRTNVDSLVISHANYDHFSAAAEIVGAYDVREVMVGGKFREHSLDNPPAEGMLRALDQLDRPPRTIWPGDVVPLGRETTLEVLWPPPSLVSAANDASLVVRLTHVDKTILFTGDIQSDALAALLEQPERLRADVLIAPHHGSSEDATPAFVGAVNPSVIVSSNDRTLTMKQRNFERMVGAAQLYRTNRHGAVTVRIDGAGSVTVEPFLGGDR
jgi:competence protein ComEC